jgi:hypothetical protein
MSNLKFDTQKEKCSFLRKNLLNCHYFNKNNSFRECKEQYKEFIQECIDKNGEIVDEKYKKYEKYDIKTKVQKEEDKIFKCSIFSTY